jgi:hypothetical protein
VPGEAALCDGIRLQPAFGTHTAGSQFVVVDNAADGRWIFAGDNMYQYENVEGLAGDEIMVPIAMSTGSPTTWLHTIDSVVSSVDGDARRILPFHEGNVWKQFPSVEFDDGLHLAEVSLAGGHPSLTSRSLSQLGSSRSGAARAVRSRTCRQSWITLSGSRSAGESAIPNRYPSPARPIRDGRFSRRQPGRAGQQQCAGGRESP